MERNLQQQNTVWFKILCCFVYDIAKSLGLIAFDFEPEFTEEELLVRDLKNPVLAVDMAVDESERCQCLHCRPMTTAAECVCCRSSTLTAGRFGTNECITEDRRIQSVVLNEDVLTTKYVQMMLDTGRHGLAPDSLDNRCASNEQKH